MKDVADSSATIAFVCRGDIDYAYQAAYCIESIRRFNLEIPVVIYHTDFDERFIPRFQDLTGVRWIGFSSDVPYVLYDKFIAIEDTPGDVLFLDCDTEALGDLEGIFARRKSAMHTRESNYSGWAPRHQVFFDSIDWRACGYRVDRQRTYLWNAGVIYLPAELKPGLKRAADMVRGIVVEGKYCKPGAPDWVRREWLLEQFVVSVSLQNEGPLEPADSFLAHHWSVKRKRIPYYQSAREKYGDARGRPSSSP